MINHEPVATESQPIALVFDDNLMSVMRLEPQLRNMGYRVQTLRALPEATNIAEPPQLVIINLGSRSLPGVDLITACKERYPAARVVGFCGHLEIEIRRAAKAAGLDKLLTNDQALADLKQAL